MIQDSHLEVLLGKSLEETSVLHSERFQTLKLMYKETEHKCSFFFIQISLSLSSMIHFILLALLFLFFIEVSLIYNIVLVSGIQVVTQVFLGYIPL